MTLVTALLAIGFGLVVLTVGGDLLLRGAVTLARLFSVSPLLIGLTVVSAATSMPELVVTVLAALSESQDLGVGNIIGSNIFNVFMVLGSCGVIWAFRPPRGMVKRDGSVFLLAALLFTLFAWLGEIGLIHGLILIATLAAYIIYSYYSERQTGQEALDEETVELLAKTSPSLAEGMTLIIGGGACLVYGADLTVEGSVTIARIAGLSEAVIGLTLVAFGTSLPELAASLVASFRKQSSIAIGNIVGSNIFNLLLIGGVLSTLTPITVADKILTSDMWFMLAATLFLFLIILFRARVGKLLGFFFLGCYALFLASQFI